jgi:hypothetical protein
MGSGCIHPHFLDLELVGGEWSASRLGRFTPSTHYIGGWVDPRAGLDDMEKWKFLPHRDWNSDSSVLQPVASRYTDWAIPALKQWNTVTVQGVPFKTRSKLQQYMQAYRWHQHFCLVRFFTVRIRNAKFFMDSSRRFQCEAMLENAREHTLLASAHHLCNWRQQEPSNQGDIEWSATKKVKRERNSFWFPFHCVYVICFLGCVVNCTLRARHKRLTTISGYRVPLMCWMTFMDFVTKIIVAFPLAAFHFSLASWYQYPSSDISAITWCLESTC